MPADYTVVTANSVDDLIRQVKDNLQQGWQPIGGFSPLRDGVKFVCYQAMVKPPTKKAGTWGTGNLR